MNTDENGYLDSLTERVLAAVFEVSNTLGAGFLEKVSPACIAPGTRPSRRPGYRPSFIGCHLQGLRDRRVLRRHPRRRRIGNRAEMRGTSSQRAHRAMPQLSPSLRT